MKLRLAVEGSVQILILTESITSKDVAIIKAGVGKLLKNGKNRIILEMDGANSLPDEVIRDIGVLDNLARELAGRIVIVCANEILKKKLEVFAKPPLVLCCTTRKSALAAFSLPELLDEGQESNQNPLLGGSTPQSTPPFTRSTAKDAALAEEVGELGRVRRELAEMKKENQILHDQLLGLVKSRRQNVDSEALLEKIRALELEVEKLLLPSVKSP